jgi:serine/threonine protein kinase
MFRTLRHTNVVTLYDIFMTSSAVYLVLELCSCNLRQHLHEQQDTGLRTTEPQALCRTASHIFSALAYLHELRIIHRWVHCFQLIMI